MAILPNKSQIHVDRPLSNILVANLEQDGTSVADAFPTVDSPQQSNMYFKIPQGAFLKTRSTPRAPMTETPGIVYTVDPNNRFNCLVYGAHTTLDDQTLGNADSPIDLYNLSTKLLASDLKLGRERNFVNAFMRPAVWTGFNPGGGAPTDFDPTQSYSHGQFDLNTADPIRDMRYLATQMQARTGKKPNFLALAKNVYEALCNNPVLYARKQYVSEAFIDTAWLARAFQVETVVVMDMVLNTAEENQPDNTAFMVNNCFLLCYKAPAAGLYVPSAGYTFRWTNYAGANGLAGVVRQWREEKLRATWLEAETCYDFRIVSSELGIFGTNVLNKP